MPKMKSKKTFFNPTWADANINPQWSPWLQGIEKAPNMARCTYCSRSFSLSNMGSQAIKSHMTSAKHVNIISIKKNSESMKNFFSKDGAQSSPVPKAVVESSLQKSSNMNSFVRKENVLGAELLWAMKLVSSHSSYNSFSDVASLFEKMFDDSNKAKAMSLGRAKMSYLVTFSLAPYFKKILLSDLKGSVYVICFDEFVGIASCAILAKSGVSDLKKREFRTECTTFLIKLTSKLMERSPIKYNLVKYISALDPKLISSNEILSEKRMEKLLCVLYENEWINSVTADKSKSQYKTLLLRSKGVWKETFVNSSSRIDHFYRDLLDNPDFLELFQVVKLVLLLSHGNAAVESGFSVNKDMLVENLQEHSLIAMRTVYHGIRTNGGVLNIQITPEMLCYARSARSAYHEALKEKKLMENKEKTTVLNKRKILTQIKNLESKKKKNE